MLQAREDYDLSRGFFIKGGKTGVLLLHGFIGNASEMEEMADYLASKGMTVFVPTLPGRGLNPKDMIKTTRQEWLDVAIENLKDLKGECSRVFVGGQSMGGTIALHLAANNKVDGVISLATPVWINPIYRWSKLIKYIVKFATRVKIDVRDPEGKKKYRGYNRIPLASVGHLSDLVKQVRAELPRVRAPLLIVHSKADQTIVTTNARIIYDRAGSSKKKILLLEKSGHLLSLDYEREEVFKEACNFITDVKAGRFVGRKPEDFDE